MKHGLKKGMAQSEARVQKQIKVDSIYYIISSFKVDSIKILGSNLERSDLDQSLTILKGQKTRKRRR